MSLVNLQVYLNVLRTSYQDLHAFFTENSQSLALVSGLIIASSLLAMCLNFSAFKNMFFSRTSTQFKVHGMFRLLNWVCSAVFLVTFSQLVSRHSSLKNELTSVEMQSKFTLVSCFLSLAYLIGFFSVSAVAIDIVEVSRSAESQPGKGFLIFPIAFFAVASFGVLTLDDSMWARAMIGTTTAIIVAVSMHFIQHYGKSLNRDGNDFNDTVLGSTRILSNADSVLAADKVQQSVNDYDKLFAGARTNVGSISTPESIKMREDKYAQMVASFYDLVTDFYEWGWGQSFHFAARFKGETFKESIVRAEYHLASALGLSEGKKCLDMGCGVGGPMRNIARFSGATVEGITINEYQVRVANRYNKEKKLEKQCKAIQGDFMKLPYAENSFDGVYAIEATCHAPDKALCFAEVHRVLKPGGLFAGYEWCMVDKYDKDNKKHVELKEGIEVGNGLPTLATPEQVVAALEKAGFEVVTHYDSNRGMHTDMEIPWYDTLNGKMTLQGFRMTKAGRFCTHILVSALEFLKIAPKGSVRVSQILCETADDLVLAGKMSIFTPDYFFLARKPMKSSSH